MRAKAVYLFRHVLQRDAAYDLQLPAERARLHALAFRVIEESFGGRARESSTLASYRTGRRVSHPTDAVAAELADRAYGANEGDPYGLRLCAVAAYLGRQAEARLLWREGAAALHEIGDALTLARCNADMRQACAAAKIAMFE